MSNNQNEFMNHEQRKELVRSYLGKTVYVKIDRPIGFIHNKAVYPINYGYIPGAIGGDGEELDVYVLGVNEPITEFTGRVIAIIHREDDVEDKLVVALEEKKFNQVEIEDAVHFQEQYYTSHIEYLYHKSCGVIIFRKLCDNPQYLLLFQKVSKTWSFPKGHMESGETEHQTAKREAKEETGMDVNLLPGFCERICYPAYNVGEKTVILFLAPAAGNISVKKDEIDEYKWADKETAIKLLKHEQYENILDKAEQIIRSI